MINKIDFKAKNLTSNAGLFLLLENAKSNGIFDFIENDLVFDNDSTNKIKMNHIKTMLCGHFIGIDKLERLKLLQNDPLVNEFDKGAGGCQRRKGLASADACAGRAGVGRR